MTEADVVTEPEQLQFSSLSARARARARALAMPLTSIGLKATTPVDNAAVDTGLDQDVGHLHCTLCQGKWQGVVKVRRALSVEDCSLD